jgi:hypothetical protein
MYLMSASTTLLGYDNIWKQLCTFFTVPNHFCITGIPGCGKTTAVNEFITNYYAHHGLNINVKSTPEWIFFLNGDQDRGIHRVRESLLDFVRQPTKKKGVVRWVVVDDMDTFPELSQQALRRPMELYRHVTCFIFVGNHINTLIPPLQSRCKHLVVDTIILEEIGPELLRRAGVDSAKLSPKVLSWFAASSYGNIAEYCHHAALIAAVMKHSNEPLTDKICSELCSVPPYMDYLPFVQAFFKRDLPATVSHLTRLWFKGFSFEDILESTQHTIGFFGVPSMEEGSLVTRWLIESWSAYCQGATSYASLYSSLVRAFEADKHYLAIK